MTFVDDLGLEVTTAATGNYRRKGTTIHRSTQLSGFSCHRNGALVTTAERTIIDVSRYMTARQIGAVIDQARIAKLVTPKTIEAALIKMTTRGYRCTTRLREALEPRLMNDHDVDSFLEIRTLKWIEDLGFPAPRTQEFFSGNRRYKLDAWYPSLNFNIEPDGPHHLLPHYALEDRMRDADLTSRGVAVLRVPLQMEQNEFAAHFRAIWNSRSA